MSARALRVEEVAAALQCSRWAVYDLIRDGRLYAIRVGRGWRIPASELDALLARTPS